MTTTYSIHFDEKHQEIIVEDGDGMVIAKRSMPTTCQPYPGREWTFAQPSNLTVWQTIYDFVQAANDGLRAQREEA